MVDPTDVPEPGRVNRSKVTPDDAPSRDDEGLRAHRERAMPPGTPVGPVRATSRDLPLPAVWLGVLLGILASTLLFLGALVLLAVL